MNNQLRIQKLTDPENLVLKTTLDVICGKWRLYILFQLGAEVRRYSELRRMIPDISEKVLIQELKALIELGVLEKRAYGEVPPRVEYGLSTKGHRILPVLLQLTTIGETLLESD